MPWRVAKDVATTTVASGGVYLAAGVTQSLLAQLPLPPSKLLTVDGGMALFVFWAGLWMGWWFGTQRHSKQQQQQQKRRRKRGKPTDEKRQDGAKRDAPNEERPGSGSGAS